MWMRDMQDDSECGALKTKFCRSDSDAAAVFLCLNRDVCQWFGETEAGNLLTHACDLVDDAPQILLRKTLRNE